MGGAEFDVGENVGGAEARAIFDHLEREHWMLPAGEVDVHAQARVKYSTTGSQQLSH